MGAMAAPVVHDLDGRAVRCRPGVAPLAHRLDHRPQVTTPLREHVLVAHGVVLVLASSDDLVVDEQVEPLREHVAGDAEPALDLARTGGRRGRGRGR